MSRKIKLVEVGPRDGLQGLKSKILSPNAKATYINLLLRSGLRDVEIGSFVSDAVTQMKNTREVLGLLEKPRGVNLISLVGNKYYAEEAVNYPTVDTLAVFTSVSETFCCKNNGCDIQKNLARIKEIANIAHKNGKHLRGYISCVFGCPFEGYLPDFVDKTAKATKALLDIGCYEVSIADTIGVATAEIIASTLGALVRGGVDTTRVAIHLHDPHGKASENLKFSLAYGITTVDCATNPTRFMGFGGCPSVPDPSSNIDIRTVISVARDAGMSHSVDISQVELAAKYIGSQLIN